MDKRIEACIHSALPHGRYLGSYDVVDTGDVACCPLGMHSSGPVLQSSSAAQGGSQVTRRFGDCLDSDSALVIVQSGAALIKSCDDLFQVWWRLLWVQRHQVPQGNKVSNSTPGRLDPQAGTYT